MVDEMVDDKIDKMRDKIDHISKPKNKMVSRIPDEMRFEV